MARIRALRMSKLISDDFPDSLKVKLAKTVKVLGFRDNRILLVREIGKAGGKPPGWGLPGGGILPDSLENYLTLGDLRRNMADQVMELLKLANIDLTKEVPATEIDRSDDVEDMIYFTAIKEVLEETHLFLFPTRILFKVPKSPEYENVYVKGEYIDGNIVKITSETNDCDWFHLSDIPDGIYPTHAQVIQRAARELGMMIDVMVAGKNLRDYTEERVFRVRRVNVANIT